VRTKKKEGDGLRVWRKDGYMKESVVVRADGEMKGNRTERWMRDLGGESEKYGDLLFTTHVCHLDFLSAFFKWAGLNVSNLIIMQCDCKYML